MRKSMAKPKYPWPLSLVMSTYVFEDGSELWPSGRELFSYLSPDGRRMNVIVANPLTPEGREFVVITSTIRKFSGGAEASSEEKERVIQAFRDYFRERKARYRFAES